MAGQRLRAERGEDPHHGAWVRRQVGTQRVTPAPARGQHRLRRRRHLGSDVSIAMCPHRTATVHSASTTVSACRIARD